MRIHFIAIGGAVMHNLAIALKKNGHEVSGSDDEIFEPSLGRLKNYGLLPEQEGWHPEKISAKLDVIILGMHARRNNPELLQAQKLGLKIYSYPEFLYQHSKNKKRVVIGGSHGKTTITAMVMHVLKFYDKNFDYIVGSQIKNFDIMVRLSNNAQLMVFEGDEYLSSPIDRRPKFHWYHPHIALISGIAWDHINVFPTFDNYKKQFSRFVDLTEEGGTLIYNKTDNEVKTIVEKSDKNLKKVPYGLPKYEIKSGITNVFDGKTAITLKVFGRHNLQNLNGAMMICDELGISNSEFYTAIRSFAGAANRLDLVLRKDDFRIFFDFAHAPSKVRATIDAVKEQFVDQPLIVCFELHTFSSLNARFIDQYAESMDKADFACVYFNRHTLEMKKMATLDKDQIRHSFGRTDLYVFDSDIELKQWIKTKTKPSTIVLMMSSGNFNGMNIKVLEKYLFNI